MNAELTAKLGLESSPNKPLTKCKITEINHTLATLLEADLSETDFTARQIAERNGVGYLAFAKWAKANNKIEDLKKRGARIAHAKNREQTLRDIPDTDEFRRLWRDKTVTIAAMGRKLGYKKTKLFTAAKAYGYGLHIGPRAPKKARKSRGMRPGPPVIKAKVPRNRYDAALVDFFRENYPREKYPKGVFFEELQDIANAKNISLKSVIRACDMAHFQP